jgi:hypothetical protein
VDSSKLSFFQLAGNIFNTARLKTVFAIGFWGIHWFIEIGGPSKVSKIKNTQEQHVLAGAQPRRSSFTQWGTKEGS